MEEKAPAYTEDEAEGFLARATELLEAVQHAGEGQWTDEAADYCRRVESLTKHKRCRKHLGEWDPKAIDAMQ